MGFAPKDMGEKPSGDFDGLFIEGMLGTLKELRSTKALMRWHWLDEKNFMSHVL